MRVSDSMVLAIVASSLWAGMMAATSSGMIVMRAEASSFFVCSPMFFIKKSGNIGFFTVIFLIFMIVRAKPADILAQKSVRYSPFFVMNRNRPIKNQNMKLKPKKKIIIMIHASIKLT